MTLFDTDEPTPPLGLHVLWHQASRRHKWRVVGSHDYGPTAIGLIGTSGLKGGNWMLIDDGHDPNEGRGTSAKPGAKDAA